MFCHEHLSETIRNTGKSKLKEAVIFFFTYGNAPHNTEGNGGNLQ
jgi:hypothetical protein